LFLENAKRLILFRPLVYVPHIDFDLSFIGSQGGSNAALHVSSTCAERLTEWSSKIQRFEKVKQADPISIRPSADLRNAPNMMSVCLAAILASVRDGDSA
jgi:hypothetical protein